MKTLLLHVSDNDQAITQISDQHVVVQKLWERSARYSRKILSGTEQSEDRSSIEDWDGFRLDPQAWARSLIGVSEQAIQLWEPTTPADGTDPPGTFLLSLEWSSPPVTRRARLECASLVNSWISAARNYQARCQRRAARDSGKSRKAALRRLDFKTWARMLRPLPVGPPGTPPSG